MPPRLIVNADDFGLTPGVNRAVAELHDAGILTSATLMAAGEAFQDAVHLARQRPNLGVGCHVVLTDGIPISRPKSIPTLISRDGRSLRPKLHTFLAAALTGQIDTQDIEREAVAQIRHIQTQGLTVTHLDTHKHTHLLPSVLKALLKAAMHTGVPAIRNPFEQFWAASQSASTDLRSLQLRLIQRFYGHFLAQPALQSGQVHTTDGTIGVSATGNLNEQTLRTLLETLPEGTWELVCHPGYNDADLDRVTTRLRSTREVERRALLAVFGENARRDANLSIPELIHYGCLT